MYVRNLHTWNDWIGRITIINNWSDWQLRFLPLFACADRRLKRCRSPGSMRTDRAWPIGRWTPRSRWCWWWQWSRESENAYIRRSIGLARFVAPFLGLWIWQHFCGKASRGKISDLSGSRKFEFEVLPHDKADVWMMIGDIARMYLDRNRFLLESFFFRLVKAFNLKANLLTIRMNSLYVMYLFLSQSIFSTISSGFEKDFREQKEAGHQRWPKETFQ